MRIAIVCYSYTQNNLKLAQEIVARTAGTLITIEEKKRRTRFTTLLDMLLRRTPAIKNHLPLDERFDHYILVSPIWGGKIAGPLKSFVIKEKPNIKSYSFISLCGGGKDQAAGIEEELTALIGQKPAALSELSLMELCKDHPVDLIDYRVVTADVQYFDDDIHKFIAKVSAACSVATLV
jgi:hypothetical protein